MTDHDETDTEGSGGTVDDTDPLLVRPWMSGGPSTTRWDSRAGRPARHAAAHRAVASPIALPGAAPAPVPAKQSRRRLLIAAGAGVAAVVVLAAAGYAAFRPDDSSGSGDPAAAPAVSLPPLSASAAPAATTGPATIPVLPPVTPPANRAPTHRTTAPATRPATTDTRTTAPATAAAQLAVPASARTGIIVGDGGRCLDLNGAVPSDGNHIQMFDCNGTDAQTWTFQTDGTLRVKGQCAQQTSDAEVHITGCDARTAEQWRAGPNGALLNLSSGGCLTDPDNGGANFTRVTVTLCTGGAAGNQRWTIP